MEICKQCKKPFKVGDKFNGWDCYDDMPYPSPIVYINDRQPEISCGDNLRHVVCENPQGNLVG